MLSQLGTYSNGSPASALANYGITLDQTGQLSVDTDTFTSAANANFPALLTALGTSTTGGFLQTATNLLTGVEDPTTGLIPTETKQLAPKSPDQQSRIAAEQATVTTIQSNLTSQISQADSTIASLESQVSYVTGFSRNTQAPTAHKPMDSQRSDVHVQLAHVRDAIRGGNWGVAELIALELSKHTAPAQVSRNGSLSRGTQTDPGPRESVASERARLRWHGQSSSPIPDRIVHFIRRRATAKILPNRRRIGREPPDAALCLQILSFGIARALDHGMNFETTGLDLGRFLSYLSARQEVIAANIANADTPGYKTRDVEIGVLRRLSRGSRRRGRRPRSCRRRTTATTSASTAKRALLAETTIRFNLAAQMLRTQM